MTRRHRLLRWFRVNLHALHLRTQGHRRAAQMMRGWTPTDHEKATILKAKANFVLRYGKR